MNEPKVIRLKHPDNEERGECEAAHRKRRETNG